jgi:PTH1 family peptidyl-tRNA hydrolase
MWLLVGLGNPGQKYAGNRHNVGFMVVDELANRMNAGAARPRMGAEIAEASLRGEKVLLLRPMEYMNTSGFAVSRAATFWKVPPDHIVVVHDDMDLDFARLKLVQGGGTGGHNGLKSIVAELGTEAFVRLRCGIGRPPPSWEGADYVLANFSTEERQTLPDLIKEAADAVQAIVKDGLVTAMNRFNRKKKQQPGGDT